MTRRAAVVQMPPEIRSQLDERLRRAGYGDLVNTAAWLRDEHNIVTSKSAIHRYAMGLEIEDRANGRAPAQKRLDLSNRRTIVAGREAEILMELGQLRVQEHELLDELRMLQKREPR